MKETVKVKKWGGENAAEVIKSPLNVLNDFNKGIKQCIVVSAMRSENFNTTDKLILLAEKVINKEGYLEVLEIIREFHIGIFKGKINSDFSIINKIFERLLIDIKFHIQNNDTNIAPNKGNDYSIITENGIKSILGFGEELSAILNSYLINELNVEGLSSEVIDLNGIISNSGNCTLSSKNAFEIVSEKIKIKVLDLLLIGKVPVISGYIPGFKNGIENTIGRGYSDATASMTSVGLSLDYDVTLEIQKSVIGIMSADPRIVENPVLIKTLNYSTAKEITGARGAQAKLLHSQVLRKELQDAGIKIRLFDPFSDIKGTIINEDINKGSSGVEFVGGRNNITVFSVSSSRMEGNGILSSIFSIVKNYTSVDIVSTSETEVSFTIDSKLGLNELKSLSNDIKKELNINENSGGEFVKYDLNKALVYCIGQNLSHSLGNLGRAATSLAKGGINIEMVSQGITERAITFGIDGKELNKAIKLLHKEFID